MPDKDVAKLFGDERPEQHGDDLQPLPSHYPMCFGCGPEHPTGLKLEMRGAGDRVAGSFVVREHHQGAPGLAHGGVLAAAVDEGMGYLLWLLMAPAVTGHLEIDYRKPVPVGSRVELHGFVEKQQDRKIYARMQGTLDGEIALEATAIFIRVSMDHFAPHMKRAGVDIELPYNP